MNIGLKIRYLINDSYNAWYIRKKGILDNEPASVSSFQNKSEVKENACPFLSVWLLNIKRIISASKIKTEHYDFIDVGCGKAISTIYVKDKYFFNSVSGFDFEPGLLESAFRNKGEADINFFEADASKLVLERKKWFVFMFNPFDAVVVEEFVKNNIEMFRATNSVIGYANAREMDVIKKFSPDKIVDIPKYRCSVIFF